MLKYILRFLKNFTCNQSTTMRGMGATIGDVYKIDKLTLERIDRLEGHPNYYCREITVVVDSNNELQLA